ncbi:MAG: glycosyltransferase family 39 protein [Phycisphaerales bacterium]|nr:glycosyltransferase family 39 protein [Phycisphaerales bacterium]
MDELIQTSNADNRAADVEGALSLWQALLTFAPLAISALALRAVIAPLVGHPVDIHTFITWGRSIASEGLGHFYDTHPQCDYLPGYLYVLWACGKMAAVLPPTFTFLIFKLPNLLTDVGIAWLIWRQVKPTSLQKRLVLPALYLFNPVIIFNSAYWGQADSFHAFVVLGGLVLCCRRRFTLSALVLGLACAVKPHSVLAVPLVIVMAYRQQLGIGRLLACCVIGAATFLASFCGMTTVSTLPGFAIDRVRITMEMYPFASVNALNLWYAAGKNWVKDSTQLLGFAPIRMVATALVGGGALLLLRQLARTSANVANQYWRVAAGLFLLTFFCSTRVHERHVYPAFALLLCAAPFWRTAFYAYALLSVTCFVNMVMAWGYVYTSPPSPQLGPNAITIAICLINCFILAITSWRSEFKWAWCERFCALIRTWGNRTVRTISTTTALSLLSILIIAFTMRIVHLNQPESRVFDEVYHAYTAQEWVRGNVDPWRWDTSAPEKSCAYEWTHPPLAKLIMARSMRLFGINAFAWRLPSAIAGTICVLLVFLLAIKLFDSAAIGLLAAGFMSLDALPLVLSRTAMNDMYCVGFVLGGALACLHRRHFVAATLIGCAIACKWTGLFALPLLVVIRFQNGGESILQRPIRWGLAVVGQGLLIVLVYLVSYTPFFRAGNTPADFVELQKRMWSYHVGSNLKHDGSSKAWQWPMGEGTLWFFSESFDADPNPSNGLASYPKKANIYAMGNLMIWWAGVGAAAFCIIRVASKARSPLVIAVFGYLVFWVPWTMSPRIMFIYHYMPALPFLYMLLAWSLVKAEVDVRVNRTILALAGLVLAIEIPFIYGLPIPVPWK